jgi:hypothetical protein
MAKLPDASEGRDRRPDLGFNIAAVILIRSIAICRMRDILDMRDSRARCALENRIKDRIEMRDKGARVRSVSIVTVDDA